jgi:hypothetical protein
VKHPGTGTRRPATGGVEEEGRLAADSLSRRDILKRVGAGMFAAPLAAGCATETVTENERLTAAQSAPETTSGKIPFSLIIDDGSPVDPLFYEIPGYETPLVVPHEFTSRVAETMERFELRGKMTLIPMPSCLGRIDQSLKRVPPEHLAEFLKIVRERIAPRFDITPEFLTHLNAYNLRPKGSSTSTKMSGLPARLLRKSPITSYWLSRFSKTSESTRRE